jgi:hypothetical protein
MIPQLRPSVQSVNLKVAIIAKIVINKINEVNGRAALCIVIEFSADVENPIPLVMIRMSDFKSHGTPKQNNMSKILDPIELQIAISARPAFFTII